MIAEARVGPVPVVAMQPGGQVPGALLGAVVGKRVGPFAQGSLDQALGFAIGPRCVGSGALIPQAQPPTQAGETA